MYQLEKDGLSVELLDELACETKLGKSLKRRLDDFDKDELLADVYEAIFTFECKTVMLTGVNADYRVKSYDSATQKYGRHSGDRSVDKVFNDLLGFRSICDSYAEIISKEQSDFIRIADMSHGKEKDDGYRGVHVYYQRDHKHYPIEIQYNTYYDRQLNNWLHAYLYKKHYPLETGKKMRELYEKGRFHTQDGFEEVLKDVLRVSKGT